MAMAMAAPLFTPCSHVASSRRNLVGSASNLLSSSFSAAGANSLLAPFPGKLSPAPRKYLRVEATEKSRREVIKLRHIRIRKKLEGTTERPRLAVFRSNKHLYAQVIDDTNMHTLAAVSTIQKDIREELQLTSGPTIEAAKRIGAEIAKVCLEKGITKVAFDRGGFVYHGRIQALAESARENGLDF